MGRDRVYGRGVSRRIRFGGVERYRANRSADSALASRGDSAPGEAPVGRPGDFCDKICQKMGNRKSVQPMAKRLALGACDQLHHFIAAGVWDATPAETELLVQADRLVGGSDAVLVIDDTAIPKKGMHSVGVAPQYASRS